MKLHGIVGNIFWTMDSSSNIAPQYFTVYRMKAIK